MFAVTLAERDAAQAQQPPSFSSQIELVTIDAVVLDKEDRPIPGLTKDDFVVKEDGEVREIQSFEAFVAPAADETTAAGEAPPATESSATESPPPLSAPAANAVAAGRTFALFFDDVFIGRDFVATTRATALTFLRAAVRPGDRVFVANTSGDLRADETAE
jgi:VWFA-related protein